MNNENLEREIQAFKTNEATQLNKGLNAFLYKDEKEHSLLDSENGIKVKLHSSNKNKYRRKFGNNPFHSIEGMLSGGGIQDDKKKANEDIDLDMGRKGKYLYKGESANALHTLNKVRKGISQMVLGNSNHGSNNCNNSHLNYDQDGEFKNATEQNHLQSKMVLTSTGTLDHLESLDPEDVQCQETEYVAFPEDGDAIKLYQLSQQPPIISNTKTSVVDSLHEVHIGNSETDADVAVGDYVDSTKVTKKKAHNVLKNSLIKKQETKSFAWQTPLPPAIDGEKQKKTRKGSIYSIIKSALVLFPDEGKGRSKSANDISYHNEYASNNDYLPPDKDPNISNEHHPYEPTEFVSSESEQRWKLRAELSKLEEEKEAIKHRGILNYKLGLQEDPKDKIVIQNIEENITKIEKQLEELREIENRRIEAQLKAIEEGHDVKLGIAEFNEENLIDLGEDEDDTKNGTRSQNNDQSTMDIMEVSKELIDLGEDEDDTKNGTRSQNNDQCTMNIMEVSKEIDEDVLSDFMFSSKSAMDDTSTSGSETTLGSSPKNSFKSLALSE